MQVTQLHPNFDTLQQRYWDSNLEAIYGTWYIHKPKACFVFMNPTARNIGTHKDWDGLRAPWLGISPVWKIFFELWFLKEDLFLQTQDKKTLWNKEFVESIYNEISCKWWYITNLCKASQKDAKPLKNTVFYEYKNLFLEEISIIQPQKIITFWWQVSSIVLEKHIKISENRKTQYLYDILWTQYPIYPVYYPVWLWMRNLQKAIEDMKYIFSY